MPELPEVYTIVSELKSEIIGKKIKDVKVNLPKIVRGDIKKVLKCCEGRNCKILDVSRRAKLILIKLEKSLNLVFHLKLTGQLFFLPKGQDKTKVGEGIGKYTHVLLAFDDGSRLIFNDLRQFGYLKILDDVGLEKTLKGENYGPEPLEKDFTLKLFEDKLSLKRNTPIKKLLMDQTVIAGVGNIYSDEILFFARVKPLRKAKDLKKEEIVRIYQGISKILKSAIADKGTSIDTYRRTTGEKGTYEAKRKVYRREGLPCFVCKNKISSLKMGGRTAHYCPKCQV